MTENLYELARKFEPFLNIPCVWTFSFANKPMWGKLVHIDQEGMLKVSGSRNRIIMARADAVIGVGMI